LASESWRHLSFRLLDFLTSSPLDQAESAQAEGWLGAGEAPAFFDQPVPDQRHGLEAARYIAGRAPDRPDLIRAALLHDIGKRHSRLGALTRSLVSAWVKLGGKAWGRGASYLDHGSIGAAELEAAGAESLVVEFARHHHRSRPAMIDEGDWQLLRESDRARWRSKPG
jgi:putative nucleotidyltransferase with HDIG domain